MLEKHEVASVAITVQTLDEICLPPVGYEYGDEIPQAKRKQQN